MLSTNIKTKVAKRLTKNVISLDGLTASKLSNGCDKCGGDMKVKLLDKISLKRIFQCTSCNYKFMRLGLSSRNLPVVA